MQTSDSTPDAEFEEGSDEYAVIHSLSIFSGDAALIRFLPISANLDSVLTDVPFAEIVFGIDGRTKKTLISKAGNALLVTPSQEGRATGSLRVDRRVFFQSCGIANGP